ncbi:hypothetical protein DN824_06790 [Stutzerimonas nosocomialis]|uniref:Protein SlyX homolog n=1 Tax=Stutzerimonas nosocomialis TaxID=1056496 RepID=A0A5R9QFS0_9GAMM|nr:SlyX family protein [Stutzerimonas nosocomialis]TLX55822.1 hypothetical protein DN826_09730 [Stutzerimonas nosocomialis]TLX59877.1 hypothetical protein DN824_06790 [Stutzerimonas nosocomialis]TLX63880.1 hypothetical protein DN820_09285 [Stutzerimonas nosocomialis]
MNLESRLAELETRLAFQDDTIQALNDEIAAQQQRLERLKLQVAALAKRQEELQSALPPEGDEAPPPHY